MKLSCRTSGAETNSPIATAVAWSTLVNISRQITLCWLEEQDFSDVPATGPARGTVNLGAGTDPDPVNHFKTISRASMALWGRICESDKSGRRQNGE